MWIDQIGTVQATISAGLTGHEDSRPEYWEVLEWTRKCRDRPKEVRGLATTLDACARSELNIDPPSRFLAHVWSEGIESNI